MATSDVSIIIAAYNAEVHLARAIGSALAQTTPPREVIVVDDGSKDGTAVVARSFGARVRLIRQENRGPGAARNRGAQEASCALLAFLDADDELLPEMTADLGLALATFPSAAAASGGHYSESNGFSRRTPGSGTVIVSDFGLVPDFFETARRHHVACVGSVLVRKSDFVAVGGFREDVRFGEDLDLWGRLAGRHPWAFVDRPVMIYHRSPQSSATVRTPEVEKPIDFMMDEHRLQEWIRDELQPSYRRYRRDMLLRQARSALAANATGQARRLLSAIAPAPPCFGWVVTACMAQFQPLASFCLGGIRIARTLLRRPYVY